MLKIRMVSGHYVYVERRKGVLTVVCGNCSQPCEHIEKLVKDYKVVSSHHFWETVLHKIAGKIDFSSEEFAEEKKNVGEPVATQICDANS